MHSFLIELAEYKYNSEHDPEYGFCGPLVDLVVEQFGLVLPEHVPEPSGPQEPIDPELVKMIVSSLERDMIFMRRMNNTKQAEIQVRKPGKMDPVEPMSQEEKEEQLHAWLETKKERYPFSATSPISVEPSGDCCRIPIKSNGTAIWAFPTEAARDEFVTQHESATSELGNSISLRKPGTSPNKEEDSVFVNLP